MTQVWEQVLLDVDGLLSGGGEDGGRVQDLCEQAPVSSRIDLVAAQGVLGASVEGVGWVFSRILVQAYEPFEHVVSYGRRQGSSEDGQCANGLGASVGCVVAVFGPQQQVCCGAFTQASDRLTCVHGALVVARHEERRALPRRGAHGIEGADGPDRFGQHGGGQFPRGLSGGVVHPPVGQEGRGPAVSLLRPFAYHGHGRRKVGMEAGKQTLSAVYIELPCIQQGLDGLVRYRQFGLDAGTEESQHLDIDVSGGVRLSGNTFNQQGQYLLR